MVKNAMPAQRSAMAQLPCPEADVGEVGEDPGPTTSSGGAWGIGTCEALFFRSSKVARVWGAGVRMQRMRCRSGGEDPGLATFGVAVPGASDSMVTPTASGMTVNASPFKGFAVDLAAECNHIPEWWLTRPREDGRVCFWLSVLPLRSQRLACCAHTATQTVSNVG